MAPRRHSETAPAFLFFPRDWLVSTVGMPREAKGLHIDLLCISWDSGPLPNSARWRASAFGADPKDAARLWSLVRPRWRLTRQGWINRRLEKYRRELRGKRAQAKSAAAARWTDPKSASGAHASGISGRHADAMLPGMLPASDPQMLNGSSSIASSSSSSKRNNRRRPPPDVPPPFKVYFAIAKRAFAEEPSEEPGAIAERFKRLCAEQGKPYDADITGRAMRAADNARRKVDK